MENTAYYERAKAMERERRWTARAKSCVVHPKYGSVIVPHCSNFTAIENAAEIWKCGLMEIISTAKVRAVEPDAGPVVRPKEFLQTEKVR